MSHFMKGGSYNPTHRIERALEYAPTVPHGNEEILK